MAKTFGTMKPQRFLFEVAHPKHFYQFRALARLLKAEHEVLFIVRDKDVSLDLVERSELPYCRYGKHGKSIKAKLFFVPMILRDYYRIIRKYKPTLIMSRSSPYASIIGKLMGIKTVVFPDSEVVPLIDRFVVPLSDYVVTPATYEKEYGSKHFRVGGVFEETYLHPHVFEPDQTIIDELGVSDDSKYFILRFIGWYANHDIHNYGFSQTEKQQLVKFLLKYGKVFVSSELPLDAELEQYRLSIPADRVHHALYFSSLYIGDSQTMATEAALLGTPSIRYNSFVGKGDMSNFKVLEEKYGLLRNVANFENIIPLAEQMLYSEVKKKWLDAGNSYFHDRGNINREVQKLVCEITGAH